MNAKQYIKALKEVPLISHMAEELRIRRHCHRRRYFANSIIPQKGIGVEVGVYKVTFPKLFYKPPNPKSFISSILGTKKKKVGVGPGVTNRH